MKRTAQKFLTLPLLRNLLKSLLFILFFILFFTGCGTSSTSYDYDRTQNFSQIKTYNYYNDNILQGINRIDSSYLFTAINRTLQSKGLTLSENPDIYIAVNAALTDKIQTTPIRIGLGGGSGIFGIGTSIGVPINTKYKYCTIQIDIDQTENKNLIWTGNTSIKFSPNNENKAEYYANGINNLFKKFPPKIKNKK